MTRYAQCRLCGGRAERRFNLLVLNKHDVGYWCCAECGSLQTDEPYWLADAYGRSLAASDVGAARRCLTCRAATWAVLRVLGPRDAKLLDFGGGSGLLCRLLRDIGIDAWTYDAHATGEYALAFRTDPETAARGAFNVVTAFEVLEHMSRPDKDLDRVFRLSPELLIASTETCSPNVTTDWWYLSPDTGQHVFFYSALGLARIAGRYGYDRLSIGGWHIFTREPIGPLPGAVLRRLLAAPALAVMRALIELVPSHEHIARDHDLSRH